jgi:hypothetical protein
MQADWTPDGMDRVARKLGRPEVLPRLVEPVPEWYSPSGIGSLSFQKSPAILRSLSMFAAHLNDKQNRLYGMTAAKEGGLNKNDWRP